MDGVTARFIAYSILSALAQEVFDARYQFYLNEGLDDAEARKWAKLDRANAAESLAWHDNKFAPKDPTAYLKWIISAVNNAEEKEPF